MSNQESQVYRVLARKYRPQNFDQLIGQDALVRTLTNAISSGRIAHAFMLTGKRPPGGLLPRRWTTPGPMELQARPLARLMIARCVVRLPKTAILTFSRWMRRLAQA